MSGDGSLEGGDVRTGRPLCICQEGTQHFNSDYILETDVPKIVRTKTSYSLLFSMQPHSLISKSTKYTRNTKGKPFIFRIFSFFRL